MTHRAIKTLPWALAAVLLCGVSVFQAHAAGTGNCSQCWQDYQRCRANGGSFLTCYTRYEGCMANNGCQLP